MRLLEYTTLGNLYEVVFSKKDSSVDISSIEEASRITLKEVWQEAWLRMQSESGERVLGHRGWSYASRRYFKHPVSGYSYFVLGEEEKNILIAKKINNDVWYLIDFIGSIKDLSYQAKQLFHYLGIRHGCKHMKLWQLESDANKFSDSAKVVRSEAALTAKFLSGGKGLEIEPWWIMMGDTDFL